MTTLEDLDLFDPPTPPSPAATPSKCRRHVWLAFPDGSALCDRCRLVRDDVATRRGKNNRTRGNAIEREVGKRLGLKRLLVMAQGGPGERRTDAAPRRHRALVVLELEEWIALHRPEGVTA